MAEAWSRKRKSIFKTVLLGQSSVVNTWDYYSVAKASKNLIHRLTKYQVLEGHTGCVNTVVWSDDGSRLLSGSDDYYLNIYDGYSSKLIHSFKSGHQANIFSAKFLPCTSDEKVNAESIYIINFNKFNKKRLQSYFQKFSGKYPA